MCSDVVWLLVAFFSERVGGFQDGAKWVCDASLALSPPETPPTAPGPGAGHTPATCLVYSFGSNGNFVFEQDVASRSSGGEDRDEGGCEVHIFDFDPPKLKAYDAFLKPLSDAQSARTHFHSW